MLYAGCHVILQDFVLGAVERGADRNNLSDDVDAVAVFLDHIREPANLAFDAAEPLDRGRLDVVSRVGLHTPIEYNLQGKIDG